MRQFARWAVAFVIGMAVGLAPAKDASQYNVLFIAVDDLRPQMGCYGNEIAQTPAMDRLASEGILFTRAYCQQAVCSPSRTSLMLGLRPDTTRVYDLRTHFRKNLPKVVTLPQAFKQHGYHTQSFGKIFHSGLDDPASWSVRSDFVATSDPDGYRVAPPQDTSQPVTLEKKRSTRARKRGPSWEAPDVPDAALPDGRIAANATAALRHLADKPFFLAVGFLKPHLPFVAPKKYFDLYQAEDMQIASNRFPPRNAPEYAMTNFGELRTYSDIPSSGPLSEEKSLELVRAYHAAMSYTDAQVGKLLSELDRLHLREKTIVILWGDHGWHLGDHGLWCKHTNFEVATRAPLILSVPGTKARDVESAALVEFVDIAPTLLQLCGIDPPAGLEGSSLVPLLDSPNRKWKTAAFSQYPRSGNVMGYSMRTEQYRYTEWLDRAKGQTLAVELYDHMTDPEENENIALRAENAELTRTLSMQLRAGWPSALPPGQ